MHHFRSPILRAAGVALLSGILLSQPAVADIIRLRDGLEHRGTIANREDVLREPRAFQVISILVESTGDAEDMGLVRIASADIEYLVFEDGEERTVIDLNTLLQTAPSVAPSTATPGPTRTPDQKGVSAKAGGAILMVMGTAMFILGATVRFGEDELVFSEDSIDVRSSYNNLNYLLMGGGGVLVIVGLAVSISAGNDQAVSGFVSEGIPHLAYSRAF